MSRPKETNQEASEVSFQKWFIFTSRGGMVVMPGDTITKAVGAFRRMKHPNPGEIVGVIRAAATMEQNGRPMASPVFGVVCCVAEDAGKH